LKIGVPLSTWHVKAGPKSQISDDVVSERVRSSNPYEDAPAGPFWRPSANKSKKQFYKEIKTKNLKTLKNILDQGDRPSAIAKSRNTAPWTVQSFNVNRSAGPASTSYNLKKEQLLTHSLRCLDQAYKLDADSTSKIITKINEKTKAEPVPQKHQATNLSQLRWIQAADKHKQELLQKKKRNEAMAQMQDEKM